MSRIRILRLESDAADLEAWLGRGGARFVSVLERSGLPPSSWRLELRVPGVEGPADGLLLGTGCRRIGSFAVRERHEVRLEMPGDFPFRPPVVQFLTPLFHPNVFPGGRLCWGVAENDFRWWRGGDGLGTIVERLLHIVVGEPQCTNPFSPANREAVKPYREHARNFPLARIEVPGAAAATPAEVPALRFREAAP